MYSAEIIHHALLASQNINPDQQKAISLLNEWSQLPESIITSLEIMKFSESEYVNSYLIRFINRKDGISDSRISGHFQRIIEFLSLISAGNYLNKLPGLIQFLVSNISTLGYRELFKTLARDHPNFVNLDEEMIMKMLITIFISLFICN